MDGWKENVFTILAEIKHERVHFERTLTNTDKKISLGGIMVYSPTLEIYGKCDAVEFIKNRKGVFVPVLNGNYDINIIEYKPTLPKVASQSDRIQVYAQYRCVKELFGVEPKAYIYYADVRRRVPVEFTVDDEKLLMSLIDSISKAKENGLIPPIKKDKRCNGCSLVDDCMPNAKNLSVKNMILEDM